MPHGVTWSRVLGTAVDLPAFEQLLGAALNPLDAAIVPARASIALAIDGNTLRGTIPKGHTTASTSWRRTCHTTATPWCGRWL